MRLVWKPIALEDRENIFDYISQDNAEAAIALDDKFEALAKNAMIHPKLYKEGRLSGTRELVVSPNYLLVYQFDEFEIQILRVMHTSRQWP